MATEWINTIITLISILGGGSLLFYSFDKKLKKLEVREKEVEITRNQSDEWRRLYDESEEERKEISARNTALEEQHLQDIAEIGMLKLEVQKLTWYRCTVNGCAKRRPPHVFDMKRNELEQKS